MSLNNRVIWSEGLFLKPQHLQQNTRYFENLIDSRVTSLGVYAWGLKNLTIDEALLTAGTFSITKCQGVMPDGATFNVPADDEAPPNFDPPEGLAGTLVFLAAPLRSEGYNELDVSNDPTASARYLKRQVDAYDFNNMETGTAAVPVGRLRLRLMLETEDRSSYSCIAIARIMDVRADRSIVLDENFIPPCFDCTASPRLSGLISEIASLLRHRGEAVAGRLRAVGQGGVAEVADFMLLQVVNRFEPLFNYLGTTQGLHPETLYQIFLQIAGELATFTSDTRRPSEFVRYQHDNLQITFAPVLTAMRQSLSMVLEQSATALDLQERKYGVHVAAIHDRSILQTSTFVFAIKANLPVERLRAQCISQIKVGPVEKIRQLVNLQLPGISLSPLPVAPRELPYHAGFSYFELNKSSELWGDMQRSGGFAFHLAGEFPELQMQLWAIKG